MRHGSRPPSTALLSVDKHSARQHAYGGTDLHAGVPGVAEFRPHKYTRDGTAVVKHGMLNSLFVGATWALYCFKRAFYQAFWM